MQEIHSQINSLAEKICSRGKLSGEINPNNLRDYLVEGISKLLNRTIETERRLFLDDHPGDAANGFSPERRIKLSTTPIEAKIPRTRSSEFYPSMLNKYERIIPGDYESILLNLLLNAKNFSAVKRTIRALNLPYRPEQLDLLINEIHQEAKAFFSRRLAPDWYFIYIDAKRINLVNENKKMDAAVVFTVVGVSEDCKKEILSVHLFWGNESIDLWKKVLIDLKSRGVTRVLSIISDDFSGLVPVIGSIFPDTDHQLCHVHLLRNALRHLSKQAYKSFKQSLDDICMAPDFESAHSLFLERVTSMLSSYPDYAKHLQKRSTQYVNMAKFPRDLRKHIRSTNPVEGVNNHIEIIKRCAGGAFHSERELFVKLKIMSDNLHQSKWKYPSSSIKSHLHHLARLFFLKFEADI